MISFITYARSMGVPLANAVADIVDDGWVHAQERMNIGTPITDDKGRTFLPGSGWLGAGPGSAKPYEEPVRISDEDAGAWFSHMRQQLRGGAGTDTSPQPLNVGMAQP